MRTKNDADEFLATLQENASRLFISVGGLASVICVGFLFYYFFSFAGSAPPNADQARQLISQFAFFGGIGALALGLGLSIIWWGEDILSVVLLLLSGALYFSPVYLPTMVGGEVMEFGALALGGIQQVGGMLGIVAIIVTVADIAARIKNRLTHGSKADSLKYGKGVKEDLDRQNVFLGKCWQLPYCRKFVREKCPIYHARRTCWKEKVGCMCEEKVIQNAMAGIVIPKDMVAAAKFIPYNNKLPMEIKMARCRQCVIFNEHQKQLYKLALPVTLFTVVGGWLLSREQLKEGLNQVLKGADRFLGQATLSGKEQVTDSTHLMIFRELLVVLLMVMVLAYAMKILEFFFFRSRG